MGRIAFVFSGQGDQYSSMGKDIYESYPCAKAVYDICDKLRPATSQQCFFGTNKELKETKNTQPCLFATELAYASILNEAGIVPEAVAGFSLGEIAACTFAGIFDTKTGFELVCKRGELMQKGAEEHDASMAAVLKLSPEQVEALCRNYENVYPVNYNCPGQITVSGDKEQMTDFVKDVKEAGGRAVPLAVKGGFHSPFMKKASQEFYEALKNMQFGATDISVYSNKTAQPYTNDIALLLSQQICSSVKWEETICNMIACGIDTFIEIGPGKTLSNMIRKINNEVCVYSVCELSKVLSEVKPC